MKVYVLILAREFPKYHQMAGIPTGFRRKLLFNEKIHTIRANYELWKHRIEEIQNGNAVLSVRQWRDKAYASKQEEIAVFNATNLIGIQKLTFQKDNFGFVSLNHFDIDGHFPDPESVAKNDGLSLSDWKDWFNHYTLSEPMAVIHFSDFRY